jgi:ELWxxDGT repeat protein
VLNNKLYFSGFDYVHGSELWVTDGTGAGTHLLKNISADGGGILSGGEPSNLITYSNKVYFQAKDDTHGVELWKTDGTAAGTKLVKDILPGINGSSPYESILFKGLLYFVCLNTQELWKTDGTAAGTKLVKGGLPNPRIAGIWKNKLYLVIDNDYFVWQTDGTNAGTVRLQPANTINGVNSLNNGFKFLVYNDELYLSGNSYPTTIGYELCKLSTVAPLTAAAVNDVNNLQADNYTAGKMKAIYNSPAKQITITNNSRLNFSWQLVSINGIVIKQGTSADAIIHIPVPGIAPGTYFLTCLFLNKKETIKLPVF